MMRRKFQYVLCLSVFLAAHAAVAADQLFDIKPLADGVYAAIGRPTFRTNCNSVIVLLDDGVLVVDTESKPSAVKELIAFIKSVTDKPVKYLVITHFHADHAQGAGTYLKEWPDAKIISSEATGASIAQRGAARLQHEIVTIPGQIEQMESDLKKATSKDEKDRLEKNIREAGAYLVEAKDLQVAPPTMTTSHSLILQTKTRTVEILFLGKAHTDGDLFVFLPKEKLLMTGDSLHSLTPTMRDCYPADWIKTLDAVEKLDFNVSLGGHGDVMHGKATAEVWQHYFADLLEGAAQSYAKGASLDETKKQLIPVLLAKYGEKFPKRFSETIISNVEKAYRTGGGVTE
jgi:cyclase